MAHRIPTRCRQPGCAELVEVPGYCEAHRRKVNREYSKSRPDRDEQAFYASNRWKELSKRYKKEHPFCISCEAKGIISPSTTTHHIKPIREGGDPWADSNMEALCASCHGKIHN